MLGNRMTVRTLLERGADINNPGANSWTALHVAANSEDEAIIRILREFHADLTRTNSDGHTPLQTAQRHNAPPNITRLLAIPPQM